MNANEEDECLDLKNFKTKYNKNLIVGHLNVNSICSKFEEVADILNNNLLDIFALSETKIDNSYPDAQFSISDFSLYRADRTNNGGGVMCFVNSNIPHRPRYDIAISTNNVESMVIEIKTPHYHSIVISVYRSPSVSICVLKDIISNMVEKCFSETDILYIIGDLNVNMSKSKHELSDFLNLYGLSNIVKGKEISKIVVGVRKSDFSYTIK